jgi:hypothetical protein
MKQNIAVVILALVICAATIAVPRRAAADDDNLQYIIPAAVGGVVAIIAIIAIIMADRSEPEYELVQLRLPHAAPTIGGVHLAPDCAPGANGLPLLCW